jgi:hypothetical protein
VKASEVISKLFAAHEEGKKNHGFDIEVRINLSLFVKLLAKLPLKVPGGGGGQWF